MVAHVNEIDGYVCRNIDNVQLFTSWSDKPSLWHTSLPSVCVMNHRELCVLDLTFILSKWHDSTIPWLSIQLVDIYWNQELAKMATSNNLTTKYATKKQRWHTNGPLTVAQRWRWQLPQPRYVPTLPGPNERLPRRAHASPKEPHVGVEWAYRSAYFSMWYI